MYKKTEGSYRQAVQKTKHEPFERRDVTHLNEF